MRRTYRNIPAGAIRVPIPDTTQQTDYSCGASSLQSICKYYGVGPDDEWEFVSELKMDRRVGSHPDQIETLAKKYGLETKSYCPMSIAELKAELDQAHPVLVMIQAYGDREGEPIRDYIGDWRDGHWVVAIGYDEDTIFFEDPSLQAVRGYLLNAEFDARWRDTARRGRHMDHFGLAVWHPTNDPVYESRAERIS